MKKELKNLINILSEISTKKLVVEFNASIHNKRDKRIIIRKISEDHEIIIPRFKDYWERLEKLYIKWLNDLRVKFIKEPLRARGFSVKSLEYNFNIVLPRETRVLFNALRNFLKVLQGLDSRNREGAIALIAKHPLVKEIFNFKQYKTHYFGRVHKPYIDEKTDTIVLEYGLGYRSNKHIHYQHFKILEVDTRTNIIYILVEIRKGGDFKEYYKFLISVELTKNNKIQKSIRQVRSTVESIRDALDYITPKLAKEREGTLRQGDLFFVPIMRLPRNIERYDRVDPNDSHKVQGANIFISQKGQVYLEITSDDAKVVHEQHDTITLRRSVSRFWKVLVAKTAARAPPHD